MEQREFNRKILLAIEAVARITWGLAQVRIWEMADNATAAPFAKSLEEASNHLTECLRDLGINTERFDNFTVRVKAQQNPDN